MEEAQLRRLRARAHVHTDKCPNQQPSANQGRDSLDEITPRFICGMREDADLVALLAAYDRLVIAVPRFDAARLRSEEGALLYETDFPPNDFGGGY